MRESMVSLERRVPHASEAVVPLERGVIPKFTPLKSDPFRLRGLACAWLRRATRARGGRRAWGALVAITGGVVMRWQRKAGGS